MKTRTLVLLFALGMILAAGRVVAGPPFQIDDPDPVPCVRIDGEFDQEGNPAYAIKMQPMVVVVSVPDRLRRRPN
jgi:hypothetical protein